MGSPKKLVLISAKKCHSGTAERFASKSDGKQVEVRSVPSSMPLSGCPQKVQPTFRVKLPASSNLSRQSLKNTQQLAFQVISDVAKLTTRISQNSWL